MSDWIKIVNFREAFLADLFSAKLRASGINNEIVNTTDSALIVAGGSHNVYINQDDVNAAKEILNEFIESQKEEDK